MSLLNTRTYKGPHWTA